MHQVNAWSCAFLRSFQPSSTARLSSTSEDRFSEAIAHLGEHLCCNSFWAKHWQDSLSVWLGFAIAALKQIGELSDVYNKNIIMNSRRLFFLKNP